MMSTQAPVEACKEACKGSSLTVADLYIEYEERLRRYAVGLTHDADSADDLVQETFIQAMAHLVLLNQLNLYQRRGWLYQVLKNRFYDQQRARKRRQALLEKLAQQALVDDHATVNIGAVYGLFELIPERYRELLKKRYVLGMTSEQIARELNVPAATVRSRLRLAAQWIRAHRSELI
ncbi:MAG: RNA polymerase sigma factor [Chloroflexi bacterium]|nr:RNA polymerase sigma factor [Chloroflexota bacterium]